MNNRRIVLASRPKAEASVDNFRLETVQTPALAEGQVLVRNHWLSLDPYMRMRGAPRFRVAGGGAGRGGAEPRRWPV